MSQIKLNKAWEEFSDAEVWKLFQNGDRHAFEYIYHSNIKSLYNYGMKIYGDNDVVEDSIQELFIELWEQKERLSGTDHINYYLFKALRSKILRKIDTQTRYSKRIQNHSDQQNEKVIYPYEYMLINQQINNEKKQKLYKALKRLPARQKEVIHLYFFRGYTYDKISEVMSMNIQSVYNLAWKSISSLKRSIL